MYPWPQQQQNFAEHHFCAGVTQTCDAKGACAFVANGNTAVGTWYSSGTWLLISSTSHENNEDAHCHCQKVLFFNLRNFSFNAAAE